MLTYIISLFGTQTKIGDILINSPGASRCKQNSVYKNPKNYVRQTNIKIQVRIENIKMQ